jgi:acid phosphatase family membrane protein YuiD
VFAVSLFFAFIVMYDAAGVRRAVSNQARILNRMLDELFSRSPSFDRRLREFIGHTPVEVFAGAFLGILLAWWWV